MPNYTQQEWITLDNNSVFTKIGIDKTQDPTPYPSNAYVFSSDDVKLPGHISYQVKAIPVIKDSVAIGIHTRTVISYSIINKSTFESWLDAWFKQSLTEALSNKIDYRKVESEKQKRYPIFEYEYQRQKNIIEKQLGIQIGGGNSSNNTKTIDNFIPGATVKDNNLIEVAIEEESSTFPGSTTTDWKITEDGDHISSNKKGEFVIKGGVSTKEFITYTVGTLPSGKIYNLNFEIKNRISGSIQLSLGGTQKKGYVAFKLDANTNIVESVKIDDVYKDNYLANASGAKTALGFTGTGDTAVVFDRSYKYSHLYSVKINSGTADKKLVFAFSSLDEPAGINDEGNSFPSNLDTLGAATMNLSNVSLVPENIPRFELVYP